MIYFSPMNRSQNQIAFIIIAIITMACTGAEFGEVVPTETTNSDSVSALFEAAESLTFGIKMDLEKLSENEYNLITTVDLEEGAYFASPYIELSLKGKFNIDYDQNEYFTIADSLIESPQCVQSYDRFSDKMVKWVKEETRYTQQLTLNTKDDFTVDGIVSLVVEPVCSRYEIAFELSSKSGELSIYQSAPVVANIY
jgi:hypothetical protein